jgi:protein OS-9
MVISTPRLCNDVAFLPPEKTKPHAIACTPVMPATAIPSYLAAQETKAAEIEAEIDANLIEALNQIDTGVPVKKMQIVGDIEVGAHVLVPKGKKLEKSVIVGGGKETLIATIAKSDGYIASEREMQKVGIRNGKEVEGVKKEVERVAAGKGWRLDVVETPRGKELRGVIEATDDEKKSKQKAKGKAANGDGAADATKDENFVLDQETVDKIIELTKKQQKEQPPKPRSDREKVIEALQKDEEESAEGSEERYKEEL